MGSEKTYNEKGKQLELFPLTFYLKLHELFYLVSILKGKYNANEDNFSIGTVILYDKEHKENFNCQKILLIYIASIVISFAIVWQASRVFHSMSFVKHEHSDVDPPLIISFVVLIS